MSPECQENPVGFVLKEGHLLGQIIPAMEFKRTSQVGECVVYEADIKSFVDFSERSTRQTTAAPAAD